MRTGWLALGLWACAPEGGARPGELLAFALDYARGPIAAYERATDEAVLKMGCGSGLSAYRTWLYGRVDPDTLAEKRRDYYTPEEIEAWKAP